MITEPFIQIRHNIEVAHRLYETKGKCEAIHGHSMWIDLRLYGKRISSTGMLLNILGEPFEFGDVKKIFRTFLDSTFDHRLLLNEKDPWAGTHVVGAGEQDSDRSLLAVVGTESLPGLLSVPADPTTEHIGRWIAEWAANVFKTDADVLIHETAVNAAGVGAYFKWPDML